MHDFDGTNPLLEALGDEPGIKEIALTNASPFIIVEPLTQVRFLPFEKTVIQVTGNAAYEQIMANINQLNALKSDVISIETSEPEEHIVTVEQVELQHNMLKFKVALTNGPEWLNGWYFQRPLGSNDEYLRLSFMNRNDGNQIYGTALNPEDTVEQYEVYFEVIYNDVTYKSPIMTAINPPAE